MFHRSIYYFIIFLFFSPSYASDFLKEGQILLIENEVAVRGDRQFTCRLYPGDQLKIIKENSRSYLGEFTPTPHFRNKHLACTDKNNKVRIQKKDIEAQFFYGDLRQTILKDIEQGHLTEQSRLIQKGDRLDTLKMHMDLFWIKNMRVLSYTSDYKFELSPNTICKITDRTVIEVLGFSEGLVKDIALPVIRVLERSLDHYKRTPEPECPIGSLLYPEPKKFHIWRFHSTFDTYHTLLSLLAEAQKISPNKKVGSQDPQFGLTPGEVYEIPIHGSHPTMTLKRAFAEPDHLALSQCRITTEARLKILGFSEKRPGQILMKVIRNGTQSINSRCNRGTVSFLRVEDVKEKLKWIKSLQQ